MTRELEKKICWYVQPLYIPTIWAVRFVPRQHRQFRTAFSGGTLLGSTLGRGRAAGLVLPGCVSGRRIA